MRRVAFLLAAILAGTVSAETVTVSAAISLKESLGAIAKSYESQSGDRIDFNFDASGKLAQQIRHGASVDVFMSADNDEAEGLIKSGDADAASRRLIARNSLVLIVPADEKGAAANFNDLGRIYGKIAIGDPRSVPAGHYAMQVLDRMKLAVAVSPRLVLCENVRQVRMYVERGEVDAGIVYGTDAKAAGDAVKVVATAPESTHEPIEYPAVLVAHCSHRAAAEKFMAYLDSKTARTILVKFGFDVPPAATPSTGPVK
jgi:molybdate transport system substrate-binding protein